MNLDKITPDFFRTTTLGLDLETTSYYGKLPDPNRDAVLLISLSNGKEHLVAEPGEWLSILWKWMEEPETLIIGHNLKFDLKFLWELGCPVYRPHLWDTLIVERILEAGRFSNCDLGATAWRRAYATLNKEIGGTFRRQLGDFTEEQIEYSRNDVKYLLPIMEAQKEGIISWGIESLIDIENRLVPILAEAEHVGICFDQKLWQEVYQDEMKAAKKAEHLFMKDLGISPTRDLLGGENYPVNLNSPVQVLKVLKSHGISLENTSKGTIEEYLKHHPKNKTLPHLLTYREHQKRASFNYPQYINPQTGRIHTTYNQCGTATGRMSSNDPNLQNVVSDKRYRRLFRASDDHVLITADYAQQEMRILAEVSGDENLREACTQSDIHLEVARRLFERPNLQKDDMIEVSGHTVNGRYTAKQAGFAIVYGAKPETISMLFGVPLPIAQRVVKFVGKEFPKIGEWAQSQIQKAQRLGYVETLEGRRRWFEHLDVDTLYKVSNMIRNHPIQGSGADMIKRAIVYFDEKVRKIPAWLSMVVHDELVVQCGESYKEEVAGLLKEAMIEAGQYYIDIETPVDYEISRTWEKP